MYLVAIITAPRCLVN